jgi:hypothetical protein
LSAVTIVGRGQRLLSATTVRSGVGDRSTAQQHCGDVIAAGPSTPTSQSSERKMWGKAVLTYRCDLLKISRSPSLSAADGLS